MFIEHVSGVSIWIHQDKAVLSGGHGDTLAAALADAMTEKYCADCDGTVCVELGKHGYKYRIRPQLAQLLRKE